jgi:hypothetical protein
VPSPSTSNTPKARQPPKPLQVLQKAANLPHSNLCEPLLIALLVQYADNVVCKVEEDVGWSGRMSGCDMDMDMDMQVQMDGCMRVEQKTSGLRILWICTVYE